MPRTYELINARSLAMHRLIADKIRREPQLFDKPKKTLARWLDAGSPHSLPYLQEWQRLLELGIEPSLAVATEDSERAATLRKSSPFTGVLSVAERAAFLKDWEEKHFKS